MRRLRNIKSSVGTGGERIGKTKLVKRGGVEGFNTKRVRQRGSGDGSKRTKRLETFWAEILVWILRRIEPVLDAED